MMIIDYDNEDYKFCVMNFKLLHRLNEFVQV